MIAKDCSTCLYSGTPGRHRNCVGCKTKTEFTNYNPRPMTNFDYIMDMDVTELSQFMAELIRDDCPFGYCRALLGENCEDCIERWLNAERVD